MMKENFCNHQTHDIDQLWPKRQQTKIRLCETSWFLDSSDGRTVDTLEYCSVTATFTNERNFNWRSCRHSNVLFVLLWITGYWQWILSRLTSFHIFQDQRQAETPYHLQMTADWQLMTADWHSFCNLYELLSVVQLCDNLINQSFSHLYKRRQYTIILRERHHTQVKAASYVFVMIPHFSHVGIWLIKEFEFNSKSIFPHGTITRYSKPSKPGDILAF